jgi:hypothetical protein
MKYRKGVSPSRPRGEILDMHKHSLGWFKACVCRLSDFGFRLSPSKYHSASAFAVSTEMTYQLQNQDQPSLLPNDARNASWLLFVGEVAWNVGIQPLAIAVSPLQAALRRSSHKQGDNRPIRLAILPRMSSAKLHTKGGAVQNRCAAAWKGETAIAKGCTTKRDASSFAKRLMLDPALTRIPLIGTCRSE